MSVKELLSSVLASVVDHDDEAVARRREADRLKAQHEAHTAAMRQELAWKRQRLATNRARFEQRSNEALPMATPAESAAYAFELAQMQNALDRLTESIAHSESEIRRAESTKGATS